MHLDHTASGGTLDDADNFRQLDVRIPASTTPALIHSWLESLGAVQAGEHVWIPVRALEGLGRPDDPAWIGQFSEMIAYAERSGWTRTADEVHQVRAHLVTT